MGAGWRMGQDCARRHAHIPHVARARMVNIETTIFLQTHKDALSMPYRTASGRDAAPPVYYTTTSE